MAENTIHPDFHSSPYDPKWWLNPSTCSTGDFSHDSQDNFCDFSQQFPTSQVDDASDSTTDACEFSQNWYVDDLLDQVYSLQKLPSQSMKNYISEAKSLAYALDRAGEPIDEVELIVCIIDGLDDSLSDFRKSYYEINPSLSLDLLSHMLLDHEKLQAIHVEPMPSHSSLSHPVTPHPNLQIIPEISTSPPPPSISTPSQFPNPPQSNPTQRCDISHTRSPPTGPSDEHLSAFAQSRQPEHQSRQSSLKSKQSYYQSRQPDDHLSAFSQFSSIDVSTPPGPKSNIAPVSFTSIRSTRLASAGSLVHSLLYGSSSSLHPSQRSDIFSDSISSPFVEGHSHPYSDAFTHSFLVCDSFMQSDNVIHGVSNPIALEGLYGLWRNTEPGFCHHSLFGSLQDGVLWPTFGSKLERHAMLNSAELPICDQLHKTIFTLLRLTATVSPHMFGRSLRFASYFWIDVIIMHATLLFNLSWILCVFSTLRGVIVSLVLQSHGHFPKFKLKLRLPPFRLRGRIREYSRY